MLRPETLPGRIQAALAAGAAGAELGPLYYECYGQRCHQRPRLEHYLRLYLAQVDQQTDRVPARPTGKPSKPTPVAYQFKAFAQDLSAITVQADGSVKEVHAGNLTPYDADYLIKDGKGHLLEQVSDQDAQAAGTAAKPTLSTRTNAQALDLAPDKVIAMVDNPNVGNNDAQLHDAAELQARQKQAQAQESQPAQPALKVAIVPDSAAGADKPTLDKK